MKLSNIKIIFSVLAVTCFVLFSATGCDNKPATETGGESTAQNETETDSGESEDNEGEAGEQDTGDGGGDSEPEAPQIEGPDTEKPEVVAPESSGDEDSAADGGTISLGNGKIEFSIPDGWEEVEPANNVISAEVMIPKVSDEDPKEGRLTLSSATGGVQPNIDRWVGQFKAEDGGPSDDVDTSVIDVDGTSVHIVDIRGSFMEGSGGPFGPKTERKGYRMLGAVAETESYGLQFIKFYGSEAIVEANKEKFMEFVSGMKIN